MEPVDVLKELKALGCQVSVQGDSLRVRGNLTDELRQEILEHKAEILALLRDRIPGGAVLKIWQDTRTAIPHHDYTRCPCCGGGRWWVSIHGARVCAKCHPPAGPKLVVRWEGR